MPLLKKFDTPASLRDVPASSPFYYEWHKFVDSTFGDESSGENGGVVFNPARTNVRIAGEKSMTWNGFPRRVLLPIRRDRKREAYKVAEQIRDNPNHPQDEYFEQYVHKDKRKRIRKITFVTELRYYYETLWDVDPKEVLKIYKKYVSKSVALSDLSDENGYYNYLNRWNVEDGILHYTGGINTLSAAVGLAQDLVVQAPPSTNNFNASPAFATTVTSVDPRVSYDVHTLVRKGLYVSLKDPVGIYILDWNNSGIAQPNGSPAPASWWKIVRGKKGMVLRLEYEVPKNKGFVVGDMTIGGEPIDYGGQLAEQVIVGLVGIAGFKQGRAV